MRLSSSRLLCVTHSLAPRQPRAANVLTSSSRVARFCRMRRSIPFCSASRLRFVPFQKGRCQRRPPPQETPNAAVSRLPPPRSVRKSIAGAGVLLHLQRTFRHLKALRLRFLARSLAPSRFRHAAVAAFARHTRSHTQMAARVRQP